MKNIYRFSSFLLLCMFSLSVMMGCATTPSKGGLTRIYYGEMGYRPGLFSIGTEQKGLGIDQLKTELQKYRTAHPQARYEFYSHFKLPDPSVAEIRRVFKEVGIKPEHFWVPVSDLTRKDQKPLTPEFVDLNKEY